MAWRETRAAWRHFATFFLCIALGVAARGAATVRVRELVGMARQSSGPRSALVEVKAVEGAYPLYGALDTTAGRPPPEALAHGGALVEEALLARLGLQVGDQMLVGI